MTLNPGTLIAPLLAQGDGAAQGTGALFRRRFAATDSETRETLLAMVAALGVAGIGAEDRANAELILAEALNNITEHAYADGPGPVELTVTMRRGGLDCTIADRGHPMPSGVVPSPPLPLIEPPDSLPEGGFGWHIIRCLTTDLAYTRSSGQNLLSMHIPWSGLD